MHPSIPFPARDRVGTRGRGILPLLAVLLMSAPVSASAQRHADAVFFHGVIHTMDSTNRIADAMAVAEGRILAIGHERDIAAAYAGPRIDLGGRHIFPGFIDAHAHLHSLGEEAMILTLFDTKSRQDVVDRVAGRAKSLPAGRWIRGRGWDQNRWTGHGFPSKADLDDAAADHPVILSRIDGHAAWVNSKALSLAGITDATPDPPGGKIVHDAAGRVTGILLDNAVDLVRAVIPPPSPDDIQHAYGAAIRECAAVGLTGMHDMGLTREQISALEAMVAADRFPFRLVGYVDGRGDTWEDLLRSGPRTFGDGRILLAGLKLYADGALGSRGALLLSDYTDDPGNRGIAITPRDTIAYEAGRAMAHGLQVCVHAIGDAANRLVLDAYESALRTATAAHPPLRIEHVQVLAPADIPRFARLGVIASMQPTHCTSDMTWAEARLGRDRVTGAYAWRSLRASGARMAGGSDAPVERPNPLAGIAAACTRRDADGRPSSQDDIDRLFTLPPSSAPDAARYRNGWYGSERLDRMDAIRMFTRWAADAAGMAAVTGSLEAGRYADFVVLSADISTIPDAEILRTQVLETWIGGIRVH